MKKNVAWAFVGNVIYAGSQMLVLIVLAKLLDAERVGMYALGLTITTPVIIFSNLALRQVLATDASSSVPFSHYFTLRLLMTLAALLVIAGIILFSGYRGETALVIALIAGTKAVESFSDIFYGLFQHHERLDRMARSMIWRGVLMVPLLTIGVLWGGNSAWGVVGILVAWIAVLIVYEIPASKAFLRGSVLAAQALPSKLRFLDFSWPSLRQLTVVAVPLAIATLLTSLQIQLPRYLVERFLGVAMLGIFVGMSYPMVTLRTLVAALGQSAMPRLAALHSEGRNRDFRWLLAKFIGVSALGGLLLVLIIAVGGKFILLLLYQPEFAEHSEAFIWIALAGAVNFTSSFFGYGMTALRIFKVQPIITSVSLVATFVLCFWMIPAFGLIGAAQATLYVAAGQFIVQASVVWWGSKSRSVEEVHG